MVSRAAPHCPHPLRFQPRSVTFSWGHGASWHVLQLWHVSKHPRLPKTAYREPASLGKRSAHPSFSLSTRRT